MPEPLKPTSSVSAGKPYRKASRFHHRMTEDLEEALRKLAKLPQEPKSELSELPSELVVSVPVQLVCTTALVAVFALPVFYLVSVHYREEQHLSRISSLTLDFERFKRMTDSTIADHSQIAAAFSPPNQSSTESTPATVGREMSPDPLHPLIPAQNVLGLTNFSRPGLEEGPGSDRDTDVLSLPVIGYNDTLFSADFLNRSYGDPHASTEMARQANDGLAQNTNDLFELSCYMEDEHTPTLPLELLYLRLHLALIWLETHDNYTESVYENASLVPVSAYLHEARRILTTILIDPIIQQGIHYSSLFNRTCTGQEGICFLANCSNSAGETEELDMVHIDPESFIGDKTTEAHEWREARGWPAVSDSSSSSSSNGSCEPADQLLSRLRDALDPLMMLWHPDFTNKNSSGHSLLAPGLVYKTHVADLKTVLTKMAAFVFAEMEATSLRMYHRSLLFVHISIVVYVFAMVLALPAFISLTLRKRGELHLVSVASGQILECLSGRMEVLDNHFLRVVPKCLLKVARKNQSRGDTGEAKRSRREVGRPKDLGRKEANRIAKEISNWSRVRLGVCGSTGSQSPEEEEDEDGDSHPRQSLRQNYGRSVTTNKHHRKFPEDKRQAHRTNTSGIETAADSCVDGSGTVAQQGDIQSEAKRDSSNRLARPSGLTTVFVQSAETSTRKRPDRSATPFALKAGSSSDCSSPGPIAPSSVLDMHKKAKSQMEVACSQSPNVQATIMQDQYFENDAHQLPSGCPNIMCDEPESATADEALPPMDHLALSDQTIYLHHNFNSPLSHSPSPAFLYLLPERNRSAPSYIRASPCYLNPSPQFTITSSGYQYSISGISSTPTICLSPSSSCDQHGLVLQQRDPSPATIVSITNSAVYSSQTLSFIEKSEASLLESLNPSLRNVDLDSRSTTRVQSSAITSSGPYPKDSTSSSTSEKDDVSSRYFSPSPVDKSSTTSASAKTVKSHERLHEEQNLDSTVENNALHVTNNENKGMESIRKSLSDAENPAVPHPRASPTFLRHISVLALTVPELQAVLDLASQAEFLAILTQLTDILLERMQQYNVFMVEQTKFTFIIGAGSQDRNVTRHVQEVSSLALDFMSSCGDLEIDYSYDRKIRPKIGIHTGGGSVVLELNIGYRHRRSVVREPLKRLRLYWLRLVLLALICMAVFHLPLASISLARFSRGLPVSSTSRPCVAFVPVSGRTRCRVVGNVRHHAVQHMEHAFPNSILTSARTCDLLKSAKAPFELVKRDFQSGEPRYLQRSRFLSGHLNESSAWAEGLSEAPSLYQLITRPKYSFDSDDLYTPTQQRSPDNLQARQQRSIIRPADV
ncbi:hypothetical protein EGW08_013051 [Elysia chlorotica]|uniref:Guanylate cyclase domain-containing protein n=1 Tax=Elysia chlorotica TaxID=188477 RepID=A0A433TC66_ELYCH|nr:hypothetical protein EGW08_013051 [Elysia chlorotica]